jgi:hypothetical protein
MKKQIILAVIFATMLASCTQDSFTDVTIIKKSDPSIARSFVVHDDFCYEAKTLSGNTVTVVVEEAVFLAKKMPYKARMRKNSEAKFGFIEVEHQSGDFLKKP